MLIARILLLSLCATATFAFAQGGFPTTVETVQVTTSTMQASVRAVGTLIAEAAAVLRAEVPGQVLEVHFAEGQRVRKGDRLFSIEATVLEAEVNEARANAERSTAAFDRARRRPRTTTSRGIEAGDLRAGGQFGGGSWQQSAVRHRTARLRLAGRG